jgi:hypothetical protein
MGPCFRRDDEGCIVAREGQRVGADSVAGDVSSTSRLFDSITDVSGILDHPLEPVIGLAEGETRWRMMTARSVAQNE